MSKTYDLSLKGLFKDPPVNLLKLILGVEIDPKKVKFLDVKLPKLVEREADLLMEYEGQIYHIEFQSTDDPRMALRMFYYHYLILEKHDKVPIQVVIYVGEKPIKRMKNKLTNPFLYFVYKIVDLKEVDCKSLIESSQPSDWVIAVLCRMDNEIEQLRRILQKIASLPNLNQRRRYLEYLTNLLGLRKYRLNLLKEEVEKMPITFDVREHPLFREGLEVGLKEGLERGLKEGLEKGLKKSAVNMYRELKLPIETIARVLKVDPQKVERWLKEADLLEEQS